MVLTNGTSLGIFTPTGQPLQVLVGGTTTAPKYYVAQIIQDYPRKVVIRGKELLAATSGYSSGKPATLTADDIAKFEAGTGTIPDLGEPASVVIQGYAFEYNESDGTRVWKKLSDYVDNAADTNGDGVVDDQDTSARSGNWLTDAWAAAQANPVPYLLGAVAIGFVVYKVIAAIAVANSKGGKKKSGGFRLF